MQSTTSSTSSSSGSIITSSSIAITTTQNATYSTRLPITSYNLTTIPTDTAWPPSRTQAGQPGYCRTWHLVSPGDSCQSIVNEYGVGVTMDELYAISSQSTNASTNPIVSSDYSGIPPSGRIAPVSVSLLHQHCIGCLIWLLSSILFVARLGLILSIYCL